MNFDFSKGKITIVIAPVDMRSGINRLSSIALNQLAIDIERGNDFVIFVSRSLRVCKMIWCDNKGINLLTRRLHSGRFERFLAKADEVAARRFTFKDLMMFFDGEPIMIERDRIYE